MFLLTHKSGRRGYTLIELLVVFALVTIIAGTGFAGFSSYAQHQAVNQAAADVKQAFNNARYNALSQVKPNGCDANNPLLGYKVTFPDTHTYVVQADCQLGSPPPAVADTSQLPTSLSFSEGSLNCSGVEFYTLSHVVSIPSGCGSIQIKRGDVIQKTLTVGSNGIVTISP